MKVLSYIMKLAMEEVHSGLCNAQDAIEAAQYLNDIYYNSSILLDKAVATIPKTASKTDLLSAGDSETDLCNLLKIMENYDYAEVKEII